MAISLNPPRSSLTLLDGKDVLRQTHSPRVLSNSIDVRCSSVSHLNTGNGLSGGHRPARSNVISACCTGDVSPAIIGLGEGWSIASPLAAPLQCGKNRFDQMPLSANVTPRSVGSKPGPAEFVAYLPSRPRLGDSLCQPGDIPARLAFAAKSRGRQAI